MSKSFKVVKAPASQKKPLKMRIETEVKGTILRYRGNLSWSEEKFSNITKRKEKFRSSWIENFKRKFNQGKDFEVKFEKSANSTILSCDIHNEISKSGKNTRPGFLGFSGQLGWTCSKTISKNTNGDVSWKGKIRWS